MSNYEKKLYESLMNLVQSNKVFFYRDQEVQGKVYRVFSYGLSSWSDFLNEGALDSRGAMFDVTNIESPVLVSLPAQKFFNYEEGSVPHHLGQVVAVMDKLDGSLVITYEHDGELKLRTREVVDSVQAKSAMRYLDKPYLIAFKDELHLLDQMGYTVCMEYCGPNNRIVIPYEKESLKVLLIRNRENGQTLVGPELVSFLERNDMYASLNQLVQIKPINGLTGKKEMQDFVNSVRETNDGEGVVVLIEREGEQYLVKIKSKSYSILHKCISKNPGQRVLYEAIINGVSDDLRGIYTNQEEALNVLVNLEKQVLPKYNELRSIISQAIEEYGELPRKEFSQKIQEEHPELFGVIMHAYVKGVDSVNLKNFALRNQSYFLA